MQLRQATEQDRLAISILLDTAFEGPAENRLVAALRESGDMALELVAEDGEGPEGIWGYVAFAELRSPPGWWSLSPVAVLPERQRKGLGGALIREGLDRARRAGAQAVAVLGDPDYYRRFGFSSRAAEKLRTPYSVAHTLLYPIAPGQGGREAILVYPEAFRSL